MDGDTKLGSTLKLHKKLLHLLMMDSSNFNVCGCAVSYFTIMF